MREGWYNVKLTDVCRLINGRAYRKTELLSSGKYPVLRVGNFFTNQSWYYSDLELDRDKYCDNGDLLYAWSASFGPRIWEGGEVIFHYHIWKVKFERSKIDRKFLYYWFDWDKEKIKKEQGVGTTMLHVTKGAMEQRKIWLPPLPEQKRIVAVLDEAFAGIATAVANTEKNLANARELFENYLNGVFSRRGEGWIEKPLKEFSESVSTGPFGSMLHKSDYVTVGVPLVNPVNIVDGTIRPDERKMISSDTRERLQSYILRAGDIVIARRGEIGRCAVVTKEQTGWVCGTGCFFVRPGNTVDPYFLAHMLRSVRYRSELERLSSGATMLNLSNTALSNLRICIPSLAEQRNIIAHMSELLAQCEEVRSIYRNKLHALAELKQSLLQKAFSGELTAIPQDEIETALA